jgi:hypothetical protein
MLVYGPNARGSRVGQLSLSRHESGPIISGPGDCQRSFPGSGVEAQAQLPVGRAVLVEGLDPQRPLCRLNRILQRDAMLERARVNLHAAKWASAARIASDLLMEFIAAAASRASSSAAVSRTATTCIGSAPRPGRPRPRRFS